VGADCRSKIFAGVCVSLPLGMPFARFYTRAIYWDLSKKEATSRASTENTRCCLSHQAIRSLQFWKTVTSKGKESRQIRPTSLEMSLHTDAADLWYWGYTWAKRTTWRSRPLGIARRMVFVGQGCPYYLLEAESGSFFIDSLGRRVKGAGAGS
jgi:hypothetical protein